MGYPSASAEIDMLEHHAGRDPLDNQVPASDPGTVRAMIQVARAVYAADSVKEYVVRIVRASRESPQLRLGASPRAALHLLRAAQARAALAGRTHVLPDDIKPWRRSAGGTSCCRTT